MPASKRRSAGLLGGFAAEAEAFVRERIDRLSQVARERADALVEDVGERFSRHLVDQISSRLAARLAWAVVSLGALIIAVWLLAVGLAGALGEAFGSLWMGQLAAGGITLGIAVGAGALASRRRSRAAALEAAKDAAAKAAAAERLEAALDDEDDRHQRRAERARAYRAADDDDDDKGPGLLRRHPLASAAVVSAAALLAGTLAARSNANANGNGKHPNDD